MRSKSNRRRVDWKDEGGIQQRPSRTLVHAWVGLFVSFYWLAGVVYLPTLLKDYDAVSMTISELGVYATPTANLVNYAWSVPLGWLQCWAVLGEYRRDGLSVAARQGLLGLACVGIAYVICGVFPCDPGSPLWGSWRQTIHNLFGGLEYFAGGLSLLLFAKACRGHQRMVWLLVCSGISVLVGLLMISIPAWFGVRGFLQRLIEGQLFAWLACWSAVTIADFADPLRQRG